MPVSSESHRSRDHQNSASHREQLYEIFTGTSRSTHAKLDAGFDIGLSFLDLPFGFLTRINDETQEITVVKGNTIEAVHPGATCSLGQTYCQRTINVDGALSVRSANTADTIPQHAVDRFGIETYIGAKVLVEGELFGTVCFGDPTPRDTPFSEAEELFVEVFATLVGQAIERDRYAERLERQNDRLQAQKERVNAQKQRFETIAEASSDLIFRVDSMTEFTYLSQAAERLLGYDPDALTGQSFVEILPDEAVHRAMDLYAQVASGDPITGVELDLLTSDGDIRQFEINARPVENSAPEDAIVQGIARDVTDRKRRQQELEIKTRAMDDAGIGIVIADATTPDIPLTYVNDAFCEITGFDREAALGRNCRFLQGPATAPEQVTTLRKAIAAGDPVSVELVNYRRDGTAFWNDVSITPITNDEGETVQFIGFQRDVTERKRREQLLEVLNRVLRHNLRNKLNIILGQAWAAEADGWHDDAATRLTDAGTELLSISEQARKLYQFIESSLDPQRIDPAELIRTVISDVGPGAQATVRIDISTDRGLAVGGQIRCALQEVIGNALKHDPAPDTTVEIRVTDSGDEVVMRVIDDGPGIDETEASVVNTANETPLKHGSGLGLWLVNWIITGYGGSFHITARDGAETSGTVATVRVPAVGPDESIAEVSRGPTVLRAGHSEQ